MIQTKFKTVESKAYVKNGALRLLFVAAAIIAEIAYMMYVMGEFSASHPWVSAGISILAFIVALIIYGRHENSAMKMVWMLLIIAAPPFGTFMYLFTGLTGTTHAMRRRFISVDNRLQPYLPDDAPALQALENMEQSPVGQFRYVRNISGFPVYNNSHIEFFPDTLDILKQMKSDLHAAKQFIFLEYYAIEDRTVFSEIHEILRERVQAGVDVRIFYDDIGSVFFIDKDFVRKMEQDGIKCRIFNPMLPLANVFMNNRDHRKIAVIDGVIAYTGVVDRQFGLGQLVDAFQLLKTPGAELLIAGSGPMEPELREFARKHPAFHYYGGVTPQKAAEIRAGASVVVNPRTSEMRFTRYSFPSKTLEYLVSGKTVVAHMLPGIPEEYRPYLIVPEREEADALAAALDTALALSPEAVAERAEAARNFVRQYKTCRPQGDRILAFLSR